MHNMLVMMHLGFNSLTINDVIEGTTFPSIAGTTLKIPLPFFFNGNPGLSIPLISLQYHEVELEFTLHLYMTYLQ